MHQLKEFLTRIQTFNLRVTRQKVGIKQGTSEVEEMDAYDITRETNYYDSFSYKSELRVLKDMAFLDILTLDKERIELQLAQLNNLKERFKQLWATYHHHHSEWYQVYKKSYIFNINLNDLFIVNNLQGDNSGIGISGQFVEDLGDSVKLRENFLMELIHATEKLIKPELTFEAFQKSIAEKHGVQTQELPVEASASEEVVPARKPFSRYPTFKKGIDKQFLDLLKDYFIPEEHSQLKNLLLQDKAPTDALTFRGFANQLADAFKQLFDANLIVGCAMADLERWIAPKFVYLANGDIPRELTEHYLNSIMSTKTRPCKSPILKIEQKDDKFLILPTPRNKK